MKKKYNKLTCLFGHHDYNISATNDKRGYLVRLCQICKRSGYYKWENGEEGWFDYDEKGNLVHRKWDDGYEYWIDYDEKGNMIHAKYSNGGERWLDNNGKDWVKKKPENWKHEKEIQ